LNNQTLNKKKIFRWLKVSVLLYCLIGIALYYLQEKFLFHPVALPGNYQYRFNVPFKETALPFSKTDTMSLVQFLPKDSLSRGVVLYFHGNKENINRYAKFAAAFTQQGYEVWMPDYPGFGKSVGERSEANLNYQAQQLYNMAKARCGSDSILLYGKSFGTGIAAYVAINNKAKRVILETPYHSIPNLFGCYAPIYPTNAMSTYKIPTNDYLAGTRMPITIFHGTGDWVVPYRCAARLKKVLKPGDEFITIEGGSHHDLASYPLYQQKLDSLLRL
jgi:uncharacterized protein